MENKRRFFGLYIGQDVFFDSMNHSALFRDAILHTWIENIHLKLRPLSSITDEEAIEIAKILRVDYFDTNRDGFDKDGLSQYIEELFLHETEEYSPVVILQLIDYLRSTGFALRYMDLSVEEQINYGWIKLTV